jgi:hypothetical protein
MTGTTESRTKFMPVTSLGGEKPLPFLFTGVLVTSGGSFGSHGIGDASLISGKRNITHLRAQISEWAEEKVPREVHRTARTVESARLDSGG